MNCCGSKRKAWTSHVSFSWEAPASPPPAHASPVLFRYTGTRGLKVTGGVSGRVYQFLHPGAEVPVDPRDVPGMQAVPLVERC